MALKRINAPSMPFKYTPLYSVENLDIPSCINDHWGSFQLPIKTILIILVHIQDGTFCISDVIIIQFYFDRWWYRAASLLANQPNGKFMIG